MPCLTLNTHVKDSHTSAQTIKVKYGDTLKMCIDQVNQYRIPTAQITILYNSLGQIFPSRAWNLKIQENLTLYLDQP